MKRPFDGRELLDRPCCWYCSIAGHNNANLSNLIWTLSAIHHIMSKCLFTCYSGAVNMVNLSPGIFQKFQVTMLLSPPASFLDAASFFLLFFILHFYKFKFVCVMPPAGI